MDRPSHATASELHRVIQCPGYPALKRQLSSGTGPPKQDDANFGKTVHSIVAGELSELTAGEKEAKVAGKCKQIRDKLTAEIFGDVQPELFIETRFYLHDRKLNKKIFSAQPDYVAIKPPTALVLDYKSLYGDTPPADSNWQLLAQCACIIHDDETRGELGVEECYAAIVQPMVAMRPALVKFSFDDLRRAAMLIWQGIDASEAIGAPRIPGNHCSNCPCASRCDVAASFALSTVNEFNTSVDQLTPQMIAKILPRLATVEKLCEDIKARAKAIELAAPGTFKEDGYEIKEQRGDRFIKGKEAVQKVRNALAEWVSVDAITSLIELPVYQLRSKFIDACSAKEGCSKVEAGKKIDSILEDNELCQRKESSKRLVKIK